MKILVSAYSCEPGKGSEPGAGFALMRAAAELGECWVLTRGNNVAAVEEALGRHPTSHPVHVVGVDGPAWTLRFKRRFGAVRPYYAVWQRAAARLARELDGAVGGFDVVHHATMSAFWLPVGVLSLRRPTVVGPISGGEFTPRRLWQYLGPRGLVFDLARLLSAAGMTLPTRRSWHSVEVLIAQNREMRDFTERRLARRGTPILLQSHGVEPTLPELSPVTGRRPEVLFVGRIVTWKGVLLALEAFARAGLPEARLVFIGDGPDLRLLATRAESLGIADRVEIAGSIERRVVLDRMRRASCLLFPSFHDSAGFVVSEALSLGLPVVCLDHAGPGQLVRSWPDVPSFAVPPTNREETVEALASAVRGFVGRPAPVPDEVVATSRPLQAALAEAYRTALASAAAP